MKSLVSYILEEYSKDIRVNNLKVTWQVRDPENYKGEVLIQVPEDYSDDDIDNYLNDLLLEKMPSNKDLAEQFFNVNKDNIIDARFEYDHKGCMRENKNHVTFEYDSNIDNKQKGSDDNLVRYTFIGLKFIMEFDYFDVINIEDDGLQDDLFNIFKQTVSSKTVQYFDDVIKLSLDEKDLEYKWGDTEIIKK